MTTISRGNRYLILTDGSQKGKEMVSSIDMFNNYFDDEQISGGFTNPDGSLVPRRNGKVNAISNLNIKKMARYELLSNRKPQSVNDMVKKEGETRPQSYHFTSPFILVDVKLYTPHATRENCAKALYESLPYYYRTVEPTEILDWVDAKNSSIIFGIDQETLDNLPTEDGALLKAFYYMYQDANGIMRNCDTDKPIPSNKILIMYAIQKMDNSSVYMMTYNSEFLNERLGPNLYYEDIHIESVRQRTNTFKHEFFNAMFQGVDHLVGKYNLHISRDSFSMELFSAFQYNMWDNTAEIQEHLEKFPMSMLDIKTNLPYSIETITYGSGKSYRVTFDTSSMTPGTKNYFKLAIKCGEFMENFTRSNRLAYEFVINRNAERTESVQNSHYSTYEGLERYDSGTLLYEGVAFDNTTTLADWIDEPEKVVFTKD